jgi:preprotein translocase subunit SecG
MMDMIFSWNAVWWFMLLLYVPSCLGLIVIVLLQKGKGVGFAGAFGAGGGSEAVFGPRSSKSLPQRITYAMAGLFMLLALLMSMLSGRVGNSTAPTLVDDTGMSTGTTSAPAGSLGALFSDAPSEEVAPAVTEEAPAATTEAPAEEAAAPATATEAVVVIPRQETAGETPAPAEAAPAEETPAEAPAETPAAQ